MDIRRQAEPGHSLRAVVAAFRAASPLEAASKLANAGVPVFPCIPSTKRPATRHGFHDASTDPTVIARWWRRWPDANVAIPTGRTSGLDVVDVDVKESGSGREPFDRSLARGLTTGWAFTVHTPHSGLHAYYPGSGVEQTSWQAPGAHIDFRSDGGYVLVPPSYVEYDDGSAGAYRLGALATREISSVDGSALHAFLVPPRPPRLAIPAGARPAADPDRLAARVAGQEEGNRHHVLFWAACRMVEAGFDVGSTLGALVPASVSTGYPEREAVSTIRSAFRHTRPLDAEFRRARPRAAQGPGGRRALTEPSADGGRRRPEPPEVVTF